jgi:hypothetical protein
VEALRLEHWHCHGPVRLGVTVTVTVTVTVPGAGDSPTVTVTNWWHSAGRLDPAQRRRVVSNHLNTRTATVTATVTLKVTVTAPPR